MAKSEKALTKTTRLQTRRFDELKPTSQDWPMNNQQDQVLPDDSIYFPKTITERSLVTLNSSIQQLSVPSDKLHEGKLHEADSGKISLPDPTVLTTVGNIFLPRNQSQDLDDHREKKLHSSCNISKTRNEKSLMWSEEKGVEKNTTATTTKLHEEITRASTPTRTAVTDMTLSTDQHKSVGPNQNLLSSHLLFKKQHETALFSEVDDVNDSNRTESSDSFTLKGKGKTSEKTKTLSFDDDEHTLYSDSLARQREQELPPNDFPYELSSDTVTKAVVRCVDIQQKFHQDQKLHSDSLKPLEISSVLRRKAVVSGAEIQQQSMSSKTPSESIIDPNLCTEVTDLTRDQDEQDQMKSNETFVSETMHDGSSVMGSKSVDDQQPLVFFERPSSYKEATLTHFTVSQDQKESMKFSIMHQDSRTKHPYSPVTLYPKTSPNQPEISDASPKPLPSMRTTESVAVSPTKPLTSPSAEGEAAALEESSVSRCQLVTQTLNNLNVKTKEVAEFVYSINPQTFFSAEWYHNGNRLDTTERIKFKQRGNILALLIYDVQPKDRGIYSCVVKNKDGKTQTTSAQLNTEGGYLPCNHLISNYHSRNIHIIPCHVVFMSNLEIHQITCCIPYLSLISSFQPSLFFFFC